MRVRKLVVSTPPNGPERLESLDELIKREANWSTWKKNGCALQSPISRLQNFVFIYLYLCLCLCLYLYLYLYRAASPGAANFIFHSRQVHPMRGYPSLKNIETLRSESVTHRVLTEFYKRLSKGRLSHRYSKADKTIRRAIYSTNICSTC